MFRLLLLSHCSSHGLRSVPLHHSMPGEMAQKLDVQSSVYCASQQTSFKASCWLLSDMIVSGRPHIAIKSSSTDVVVSDVGYLINFRTCSHFEYASITTNHMSPRNGPAKSMWMRCHVWSGISHVGRFSGWFGPVSAQAVQSLQWAAMSTSMLGLRICMRANDFICSMLPTLARRAFGMITRVS